VETGRGRSTGTRLASSARIHARHVRQTLFHRDGAHHDRAAFVPQPKVTCIKCQFYFESNQCFHSSHALTVTAKLCSYICSESHSSLRSATGITASEYFHDVLQWTDAVHIDTCQKKVSTSPNECNDWCQSQEDTLYECIYTCIDRWLLCLLTSLRPEFAG